MSDFAAPKPPPETLLADRYRVLRRLGAGGMGEVFLADDTLLGRRVALKLLAADGGADQAGSLLAEARSAARLNHPNICTIFDAGTDAAGHPYISMEYLEGGPLSDAGATHDTDLGDLAIQLASALEEAHRHGIIHRDLKPSNLIRTESGRVKIVDFGLAKRLESASPGSAPGPAPTAHPLEPGVTHTVVGLVSGTVPYMSPEQAMGKAIDARSDLFSLGVVLYELAAGRRPFDGETPMETIAAIIHKEIPSLDGSRAGALRPMIERCLRKSPGDRFASAADLLRALHAAASGATNPAEAPRHNLPPAADRFVGREQELADLTRFLSANRLVTITGAGGSGKTRLAFEAARRHAADFREGVRQVGLATVENGDRVATSLAGVLGLKESPGRTPLEDVTNYLAGVEMLLVLDNCEHVVGPAAELARAILAAAPRVKVLATSREALNVEGEQAWSIPPLSLPPRGQRVDSTAAERSDAVRLFAERAASSDPRFRLGESNLDAIATICVRLDGIPLAIELAAARVRSIEVAEIQKRLDGCFRVLATGARGALPRHQTLRAAIDWSYDLLTDHERVLFGRLAVFSGGFDLDAAESLAGWGDLPVEAILDLLARLVDKSLVVLERTSAGVARYRLLESIRQYAQEKMTAAGERRTLEVRHFAFYAALADRACDERAAAATQVLLHLEREHDNLRAALTWAEREDPPGSLRLAGALGWFWHLHSHFKEGLAHLRRALTIPSARTPDLARALLAAAWIESYLGSPSESKRRALESLSIYRELGDDTQVARALAGLGWAQWWARDYDEAARTFEGAVELCGQLGHRALLLEAKVALCQVWVSIFDSARAEPLARECLAEAEALNDPLALHFAHHFLGDCALMRGDAAGAERRYVLALRAARGYGDRFESMFEVQGVAMSVAEQGRETKALRLIGAAEALNESIGATVDVPFWRELLGRHIGAAETRLGATAATAARRDGRAMGFDAAMDYALDMDRD